MKKSALILIILFTVISGNLFSQAQTEQTKTPLKPALLVIDIQNVYLSMVPEREKEVAMYYINSLIELFHSNGYPVIRIYHLEKMAGPKPGTELFESLLTTHYSLLTTHYSLLTTHYSLVTNIIVL